jgi:hypothetical protein
MPIADYIKAGIIRLLRPITGQFSLKVRLDHFLGGKAWPTLIAWQSSIETTDAIT